jgi:predicted TIM-barrel fold metal-dependent hydrolase
MLEFCQPPDPTLRPPRLKCPPGTTDTHIHLYGPQGRFPDAPTARFSVPDALPSTYRNLAQVLGIDRIVAVQPSTYGFDNSRQLTALAEIGLPGRAVVAVPFDVSQQELERMHQAGARGVRFAVGNPNSPSFENIARFAERLVPLQWHVEFHLVKPLALTKAKTVASSFPVDIVIAHIASVEPAEGIGQPDFQTLCELLRGGHCWVKLSAGYRISAEPPYHDVVPFARALVELRLDRLLWGTDWPHVDFTGSMPNTSALLDCLLEWVPEEAARGQILADNPKTLYGF